MKSKAFKFVIPVVAIIFAITASAFTVSFEGNTDDNLLITGYIHAPNNPCQEVKVNCLPDGQEQCKYGTDFVYDLESGTGCSTALFKVQPH